jgi:hypothetical protein
MVLVDDQLARFLEKIDFISDETNHRKKAPDARNSVPDIARRARISEAKPGKDQGNADRGEDDDLMDEFEGHGVKVFG